MSVDRHPGRDTVSGSARRAPVCDGAILVGPICFLGLAVVGGVADRYTATMLSRILVVGLLAVSVVVLAGWCGLPSLGQTAPMAVGAYATGILAKQGDLVGPVLLLVAGLAGAVFAALTGLAVCRARGTAFLMVTLAVGELVTIAAGTWTDVAGGTDGLLGIPATRLPGVTLVDPHHIWWYVVTVTGVVVAGLVCVLRSPAGLLLAGTRENEPRMRAAGHPTFGYLLLAYTAAGGIAGVAGSLLVTVQRHVSPSTIGFDLAALVLLAVAIGGAASLTGAFAGAGLIVLARDWLAGPWPGHGPLLVGVVLVVCVYALPDGLAGLGVRLRQAAVGWRR